MIALILAGVLLAQDMTEAEMIAEGEEVGRAVAAMGLCSGIGYTVHLETGQRWAEDYGNRASAAGWSDDVVAAAINVGTELEAATTSMAPSDGADADQLRAYAASVVERFKSRCHRLADEHTGLISDLETGDRNADAQLVIILRPLSQRP